VRTAQDPIRSAALALEAPRGKAGLDPAVIVGVKPRRPSRDSEVNQTPRRSAACSLPREGAEGGSFPRHGEAGKESVI
jgi:hypothetical protein